MRALAGLPVLLLGSLILLGACAAGSGATPAGPPLLPADGQLRLAAGPGQIVPAPPAGQPKPALRPELPPAPAAACPSAPRHRPGTEVGYLVLDLTNGQTRAELNPDLPLIPASTTKLVTALVALDLLGPDHRYRTELLSAAKLDHGRLQGDLVLKGSGDPALNLADLLGLAVRLRAAGVTKVEGRFLIDDTAFPWSTAINPNQPPNARYNQGIGALKIAAATPELALAELDDAVLEVGNRRGKRKKAKRPAARPRPVLDPGLHAGQMFHWLARAQGIQLPAAQRGVAPVPARAVATHQSAPLSLLLRDMLVHSDNMMAEMIGWSAVQRVGSEPGVAAGSGQLLLQQLRRLLPEVNWCGATLGNGSGLDENSRLTARQLAALARYGWERYGLPALLPGGGWSGTLSRRFTAQDQTLRVWAKTGTLNYGSALAGFLLPSSGRPAVFAVMVSDPIARQQRGSKSADGWLARARATQDELVRSWLAPMPRS